MIDFTKVSVPIPTAITLLVLLGSILASWYSTAEQLHIATKEITVLTTQMSEVKRANDEQHRAIEIQNRATEMKLYEAITTLRIKGIMQ